MWPPRRGPGTDKGTRKGNSNTGRTSVSNNISTSVHQSRQVRHTNDVSGGGRGCGRGGRSVPPSVLCNCETRLRRRGGKPWLRQAWPIPLRGRAGREEPAAPCDARKQENAQEKQIRGRMSHGRSRKHLRPNRGQSEHQSNRGAHFKTGTRESAPVGAAWLKPPSIRPRERREGPPGPLGHI